MGRKLIDLTGQLFGRLTPIAMNGRAGNGGAMWLCRCDCGENTTVAAGDLKRGYVTSCGCYGREVQVGRHDRGRDKMIGMVFGRLTVDSVCCIKNNKTHYICRCSCSKIHSVASRDLVQGNTKSCGCLAKELMKERKTTHGLSYERLYVIWSRMIDRCYNPDNNRWEHYGARGIVVCEDWRNSVEVFYEWAINNGYREDLSIDRRDNNGNYEPGNCRWATPTEQARNRRSNVIPNMEIVEAIRQDPRSQTSIGLEYGVSQSTVSRIKLGKVWNATDPVVDKISPFIPR